MATYLCLDGPLEGRALRWRRLPRRGRPVTVALVDVGHGVLEVEYRVQRPAGRSRPGDLRFVRARDAWHTPRWRARTRRRLAL
ncbi:hypothetical protein [Cellulomonas sp. ATA003]|uniref:hypothetical protein n=1 Tax=Cellulomonas sp. ATA003 TaxID=3073064 RepID=UPI0028737E8D|nr:hypothetical protein [Cellulomonas sp. ATA003]WNB84449.1 hypothetical protein REH70_11370 [Cellulomonas sp. ATA003]